MLIEMYVSVLNSAKIACKLRDSFEIVQLSMLPLILYVLFYSFASLLSLD